MYCLTIHHSVWKYTTKAKLSFAEAIAAVNPFLPRIPDDMKKEFEEDFFEEVKQMKCVIKNENNNEDNIEARYKLFVVHAHK